MLGSNWLKTANRRPVKFEMTKHGVTAEKESTILNAECEMVEIVVWVFFIALTHSFVRWPFIDFEAAAAAMAFHTHIL